MNHDGKHEQAALDQVRSDLRTLIEDWGAKPGSTIPALMTMVVLFIAGCAGSDDTEGQIDSSDIDAWIDKTRRPKSDAILAARRTDTGLDRMFIRLDIIGEQDIIDERFSYIFDDIAFHSILNTSTVVEMCRMIDWLFALDLSTSEGRRRATGVFDDALRFMVKRNGDRLGKFVTPEPVADLMLEMTDLKPGECVYDPCFGFGELLAGASRRLNAAPLPSSPRSSVGSAAVTGIEINDFAYLVTLCRLLLAGVERPVLEYDDALDKPLPEDGSMAGFDCVVAAPPWGENVDDEFLEDLFLQHVMANVRPGGRAVVALPERPLFHADSLPLRKELLSEYRVQDVIALPAGSFEPFTGISMSVIVFSRDEPRDAVRFLTVSPMAWQAAQEDARGVAEMIGDHRQASASYASPGVESWSAPVRELTLRDYELIAKKSGSERLDAEIERLVKADPSLKVKSLDEVAEVFPGVENDFFDAPEPNLLRSADVTDVRIRRPQTWPFDFSSLLGNPDPRAYLRGGDLLVPMTDNVGSIFLVEEDEHEHEYEVMADETIAFVRVHEGIVKPRFLAALLRSPAYWFWLSGHATGSTIRHLSIPVLRALKVPVPPVSVQDAVLKELGELRGDALAVLFRLLSGMARHPATLWLERPLPARLAAEGTAAGSSGMSMLSEISQDLQDLSVPENGDRSCNAWLTVARKAAAALDDVAAIQSGTGRLAILEFALARFHESLGVLRDAEGPSIDRLRSVTQAMVEIAEQEVHALQHSGTLGVDVTPAEVEAGVTTEVRLRVANPLPVPLRKVRVTARQEDRTVEDEVSYLAEGQRYEIPLVVRALDDTHPLHIDVVWQARRLDATPVEGRTKVSVPVRSGNEAAATGDLGASPYIVGNPVDRAEMFFGRDGIMDQIRRHLGGEQANVILLEGNRRTGKTSILKQLKKKDALPGWVPVYCSFQDLDSMATPDVFRLLAKQTGWALADAGIETWFPDAPPRESGRPFKLAFLAALRGAFSDGHPYETLALYLSTAIEAAKPRRVLLMLDEFDKLQEGIDGGATSPQVPENIRHLLQHQSGLGAILTGSRRLKRLREEYWSALFGFGHRIGVSALPEEEARRLVTEPVARRIRYLPQARDRLVALCARHPFLIQSLCSRVFDQAAAGSERTITGVLVERAATEMVRDNEHFRTLWGYAGSERRRLILALSDRMADAPDAFNLDLIGMKCEEHRVSVRDDEALADDITELRELELLEIDQSNRGVTYRLAIPLMAEWLRMNVDFDDLVERARQEAIRHA